MTPRGAHSAVERPTPPERESSSAPTGAFLGDCLNGLSRARKMIPCKWLYDDAGSALFERICTAPEYYPSRTEVALLADAAPWLGGTLSPPTTLVEFGSGASRKTRLLLDAAPAITRYVPIDISEAELARACRAIAAAYPTIVVSPILGDFTDGIALDRVPASDARFGFFPGSTLANFAPDDAVAFLSTARALLGPNSALLLGLDVAKDEETLLAAYDDAAGVTAAFNLNLLTRMNRELGCAIDLAAFGHRAVWNGACSRIEMHLVSHRRQQIDLGGVSFMVGEGETIHTENSHKLERGAADALFRRSGWRADMRWSSDTPSYDLILLRC